MTLNHSVCYSRKSQLCDGAPALSAEVLGDSPSRSPSWSLGQLAVLMAHLSLSTSWRRATDASWAGENSIAAYHLSIRRPQWHSRLRV
jgi:hypothetical protein